MKTLLLIKAGVELFAGFAFAAYPSRLMFILLGETLSSPAGISAVRMFGASIFAMGLASWLARNDSECTATRGLISAMLLYDAAFIVVLLTAHLNMGLSGIALWPVVLLHSALAVFSLFCLKREHTIARPG